MNVCILSMQRVDNFGSLLQAYSMKKIIESMGHEVSFLDILSIEEDMQLFPEERSAEKIYLWNRLCRKISRIDRYALNRIRVKQLQKKQDSMFDSFRDEVLKLAEKANQCKYDMCIIGSDEVFNCLSRTPWGFTSQLFGNVSNAKNVITYAASCGQTTYTQLPDALKNRITEVFQKVDAISVRDGNTYDFVEKLTGTPPRIHLDPVIIGDFEEEVAIESVPTCLTRPYCIVYSYYNRIKNKGEIEEIKTFCRDNGLEIISVGAPQMWIKHHMVLNPFQMIKVFEKANFVITDTFHGTIFSWKYAKRFSVIIRDSNKNKLTDLIERLDIAEHIKSNKNLYQDQYTIKRNYDQVHSIEQLERVRTEKYLQQHLR